jgi:hypothetical protein
MAASKGARLVTLAKYRAKLRRLPFDLDPLDIDERIQRGFCEATGIPFDLRDRRWSPSLDRIQPKRGYVRDNVQVVVWAYNAMKQTWGDLTILRIAEARQAFLAR